MKLKIKTKDTGVPSEPSPFPVFSRHVCIDVFTPSSPVSSFFPAIRSPRGFLSTLVPGTPVTINYRSRSPPSHDKDVNLKIYNVNSEIKSNQFVVVDHSRYQPPPLLHANQVHTPLHPTFPQVSSFSISLLIISLILFRSSLILLRSVIQR